MSWNVYRTIAVHGCKGGVGKSTVAAAIALALTEQGFSVGLCDLDICGPNVACILGVDESHVKWRQVKLDEDAIKYDIHAVTPAEAACQGNGACGNDSSSCCGDIFSDIAFERPESATTSLLEPKETHGIKVMSFAFIKSRSDLGYAAYRGPMLDQISSELVLKTDWGRLDYLILDLPPGTGDVIISLMEEIAVSGLVAVSTPHQLSLKDTVKSVRLFQDHQVPIICLVENMSYFTCDGCNKLHNLFGPSQSVRMAESLGVKDSVCLPMMAYGDKFVEYLKSNQDIRQKLVDIAKLIMENPATSPAGSNPMKRTPSQHINTKQTISCSDGIEW